MPSPAAAKKVNGEPVLAALASESALLFARRLTRLEEVSIRLRHTYREHTQCLLAEKQHKAQMYLNSDAKSHGERDGIAAAHSISLTTETLLLAGEIKALEEERDFLKFCIEQDAGA
jgi:hypothetical protein